ncbi:MAG TPA: tRNA-binding protein [Gammaproteobacteria bacterium]|nr:tRNA-binding protein [Gammaproteobacteria bacterium]
MNDESNPSLTWEEFTKVEIHTGTIIEAAPNKKARVPAYVMKIDFGELGIKTSSAQITRNYGADELIGQQIVAVTNFPPKRIAGIKSEVLVLGAVCADDGIVLLQPTMKVENGSRIA